MHAEQERALRKNRLIFYGVLVLSVGFILFLARPMVMCGPRKGTHAQAIGNAKMISLSLMEFEKRYGSYPGAGTMEQVRRNTGTDLMLGTSTSNQFFRQILAARIGNEKMFYSKGRGSKAPDEIVNGSNALEKGECGFAYIPGLSSSSAASMPVVIAGLVRGTDKVDPKALDGKVFMLLIDGSAREGSSDKEGHLLIDRKRLLDPTNPIWGGKPPTLVWPE